MNEKREKEKGEIHRNEAHRNCGGAEGAEALVCVEHDVIDGIGSSGPRNAVVGNVEVLADNVQAQPLVLAHQG